VYTSRKQANQSPTANRRSSMSETTLALVAVIPIVLILIAACATVGLTGVEGVLIRRNAIPALMLSLVAGLMGLALAYVVVPGLF
jgi:Sec-independent protein secretion pathway component TatC